MWLVVLLLNTHNKASLTYNCVISRRHTALLVTLFMFLDAPRIQQTKLITAQGLRVDIYVCNYTKSTTYSTDHRAGVD